MWWSKLTKQIINWLPMAVTNLPQSVAISEIATQKYGG